MELFKSKIVDLDLSCVHGKNGYMIAKFEICNFGKNENNVQINRNSPTLLENIETLNGMPLVGRVSVNDFGELDFCGHELIQEKCVDENGMEYVEYWFNTEAFGTFFDTKIEINNEGQEIITSYCKIWTRFREACSIIQRLYKSDLMEISWEITSRKNHLKQVFGKTVKVLDDFYFEGVCLLGSTVLPAYKKNAKMVNLSEKNVTNEIAQALIKDIITLQKEGGNKMENQQNGISLEETVKMLSQKDLRIAEDEKEIEDLKQKIKELEEENQVLKTENEELKGTTEQSETLKTENEELKTEVQNKAEGIAELGKTLKEKENLISQLEVNISELTPFKEEVEKLKFEAEKERLTEMVLEDGYVEASELETSEKLKEMIENLNEDALKIFKAERIIEKDREAKKEAGTIVSSKEDIKKEIKRNINYDNSGLESDIMNNFLK